MIHLSSLLLSSLFVICSAFAPAGFIANKQQLPADEIYYYDTLYTAGNSIQDTSTINTPYISRTLTSYYQALSCPSYTYAPAVGSCAAVAAGNLIGYYDRFDENLIPNHVSGNMLSDTNYFIYNIEDIYVKQTIEKLYSYITGDGYGATEDDFKRGLTQFCTEKGKNIQFYSCMSGSSFDYEKTKDYIEADYPIALFLSGYNIGFMYSTENRDSVSYYTSTANHIMIGFGYENYTYITDNGTENYEYLYVASGTYIDESGVFNIHYNTKINNALAVNIY